VRRREFITLLVRLLGRFPRAHSSRRTSIVPAGISLHRSAEFTLLLLLEGHASRHEAALGFRCLDDGACHRGDIDRVPRLNCYAVC
jgi:hypothetical protein